MIDLLTFRNSITGLALNSRPGREAGATHPAVPGPASEASLKEARGSPKAWSEGGGSPSPSQGGEKNPLS